MMRRRQLVGVCLAMAALAGCTSVAPPVAPIMVSGAAIAPTPIAPERLAADLTALGAGGAVAMQAGADGCGPQRMPLVQLVLPDRVLFATDSDLPNPDGGGVLDQLAAIVKRDAPEGALTVVGHTDAVGSDAYNMDLSRRRASKVVRALIERGLDPNRLSAVAIGERQPLANDSTAAGRARNRRVEFLISRCAEANLGALQRRGSARPMMGPAAEILRSDSGYGLRAVGALPLSAAAVAPAPGQRVAAPVSRTMPMRPPPTVAHPLPQPHYQPRVLAPQVQPNALGPAVPF